MSSASPPNIPTIPKRTYQPYRTATLETPMLHMILAPLCLSCLKPLLALIYRLRAFFAYPLKAKIIPRVIGIHLPARLAFLSVGEVILTVPLWVWLLRGYHYTWVSPNLDMNGKMSEYAIVMAYLTANKSNSVFSFLFGIPFERMLGLHYLASVIAVVTGFFHAWTAYEYGGDDDDASKYASYGSDPNFFKFSISGDDNFTGTVGLGAMTLLVLLSCVGKLRRVLFNAWLFLHIVFAIVALVGLMMHEVAAVFFIFFWWALDLIIRYGISACCRNRTKATIRRIGGSDRGSNEPAVEVSFPKPPGFAYNAGQFVQIAIPKLSIFEFHPITISSAPHEPNVTLHIRKLGDWSSRLVKLADTTEEVDIWVEPPYGNVAVDLFDDQRYKMVLLVGGGIGVTPCQSIGKSLLHEHKTLGRNLKCIKYVWAVRNKRMVDDIPPLAGDEDYSIHSPQYKRMQDRGGSSAEFLRQSRGGGVSEDLPGDEHAARRRSSSLKHGQRRRPAVVQADIYLTRSKNGQSPDEETDERLPYNLYHGRPDMDSIFEEMKRDALLMGETSVAVVGCGPNALMDAVEAACRKHSVSVVGCGEGVFFDLHKEHFEF